MTEEIERYFSEEGEKTYTLITNAEFCQLIKNPSPRGVKQVERGHEDSWVIRNFRIDEEYTVIDSSSNTTWSITFENCYFKGSVYVEDVVFTKNIIFKDCFFDGNLHFSQCEFQNLDIQECYFKKQVYFSSGNFKDIKFSQHDTKELTISRSSFSKFQIGYYTGSYLLKKLVIINNDKNNGPIEITGVEQIDYMLLYGTVYGDLFGENIKCRKFIIENFNNHGLLKFVNLSSTDEANETHFGIRNSNLNNAEFYRLDLKSFAEVNIGDSNVMNCTFINTTWPNKIFAFKKAKFGPGETRNDDKFSRTVEFKTQQRETYRQLKLALSKQGDKVQEQLYYSKEMDTYFSLLNWTHPFNRQFWDKFILLFSSWFSDYGTNFGKALLWFLGLNFIVFASLIHFYHFGGLKFSWVDCNSEAFWGALKLYIRQLNPLHKIDDPISGPAFIIDFLGRILSSYLIYHLIRSSRRFVS
jgi:uncharacterized protein YjbI with pentapeptide repeats